MFYLFLYLLREQTYKAGLMTMRNILSLSFIRLCRKAQLLSHSNQTEKERFQIETTKLPIVRIPYQHVEYIFSLSLILYLSAPSTTVNHLSLEGKISCEKGLITAFIFQLCIDLKNDTFTG